MKTVAFIIALWIETYEQSDDMWKEMGPKLLKPTAINHGHWGENYPVLVWELEHHEPATTADQ